MAMTAKECERIGQAMAREYYKLCQQKGAPGVETDWVPTEEACRIAGRSRNWLYNHRNDIPHSNRRYSRSGLIAYLNK